MITEWWSSLDLILKILWCIAIATSLIFIVQSILTFIGADTGADMDVDTDFDGGSFEGDPSMNLFTFRNLVNFLLGFSWAGILLDGSFAHRSVTMLIAALVGIALVAAVMLLFKLLSGMQQSGNIDVTKSGVGCVGKVYLTIPGQRAGAGKVQITISGAVREYDALTDGDTIPTGTPIHVVEVLDEATLLVESQESLII